MFGWHHHSMGMSLSKLQEVVKDRETWSAAIHGVAKSGTRLSGWTPITKVLILWVYTQKYQYKHRLYGKTEFMWPCYFVFLPAIGGSSRCSTSSSDFCCQSSAFGHSNRCIVVSVILNLWWHMRDGKHLFICLFAICISFSVPLFRDLQHGTNHTSYFRCVEWII